MSNTINSAPLLDELRSKGGTVYTLSGTTRDFSYLFGENDINMIPSKFVALKLPNWSNTSGQRMFEDVNNIGSPLNSEAKYVLPKTIQNYSENLIQYSEATKTDSSLYNYNEQSIWKLLRRLGALELESTGTTIVENGKTKTIYKEKDKSTIYEPIIQFVGDINLLNHTKRNGVEYNEVFLHIPTNVGKMENVYFKPTDIEFSHGLIPNAGGSDITQGLDSYDGTKSVKAIYDNAVTKQYEVGNDLEDCGVYFDEIKTNTSKHNKGDFDFNAILVYYDIYSQSDLSNKATNLYGIIFLNNFDTSISGTSSLPLFKKYQPDTTQPGNAFAEKLMLKFGSYSHQTTSEITINSFSTVSMEMYMDALRRLTEIQSDYDLLIKSTLSYQETLNKFKQMLFDYETLKNNISLISNIDDRVKTIETASTNNNERISNEEIFKLLSKTIEGVNSNTTPITQNITLSSKLMLPKVIDTENIVVEVEDGTRFQWNVDKWVSI